MSAYAQRDMHLKSMGYRSYKEYLHSDLWNVIRQLVLMRDGGVCQCCGDVAEQVHHDRYDIEVLRGRNVKPLYAMCRKCHELVEFRDNAKRHYKSSRKVLQRLLNGHPADKVKKPAKKEFRFGSSSLLGIVRKNRPAKQFGITPRPP